MAIAVDAGSALDSPGVGASECPGGFQKCPTHQDMTGPGRGYGGCRGLKSQGPVCQALGLHLKDVSY